MVAAAPDLLVAIREAHPSRLRPASGSVGETSSVQAWPDEKSFVPPLPVLVGAKETCPPAVAILVLRTEVTGFVVEMQLGGPSCDELINV